jgi:coenzyme PQQ precursor peptide PqqA
VVPGRENDCVAASIVANVTVRRIRMKWETPQAVDFRFGMEITMYIANR